MTVERDERREDGLSQMQRMALELEAYRTGPHPQARRLDVDPFPQNVMNGLWIGMLIGATIGGVFGWLLRRNIIAPRGWEGLYSMTPFTFVAFWALIGLAAGMLIVGVAFILLVEPEDEEEDEEEVLVVEEEEDEVTVASEESFPASDPPSWTGTET